MKRTLIEGLSLFVISVIGIAEGYHLSNNKDAAVLFDLIGPGYYVLFISVVLMVTSVLYIVTNYKKGLIEKDETVTGGMNMSVILTVCVFAAYLVLMNIAGYLIATFLFFLCQFRVSGVKSKIMGIILPIILTAVYYVVFEVYCNMSFPKGIF